MAMVRQLSPNSIASRSPSRVPQREAQTTCGQKTLILYTASGYIDQQTKKFVRRGRGDNNYFYKSAHNQGEKRQKDTGTAVDLSVNYEDYIACKDILARYNASSPI